MKYCFLLLGLFWVFFGLSQEEELFQVSPRWKVGDHRKVHTETSTKVIYDDSLVSNTRNVYDIQMKVLSTSDQYLMSYISKDFLGTYIVEKREGAKSASQDKFRAVLSEAEIEFGAAEFKIQIDQKTITALEIKNGLEIAKKVEYHAKKKIKEWGELEHKSAEEILAVEMEFGKEWAEIIPKIQQAILSKTTNLFSAYNLAFPMNSSIVQKVLTHDITASSKSDTLFPAEMKMETVEVNDKLIVKTNLDYDKEFLLTQLKKSYASLEKVAYKDVSIIEKEEIIFDLNSTWLLQHSTNLHFEIPGMKTMTKSVITFL
ncbi:MAG: hypothetical protein WC044_11985 [Crocinitomicaceae bacterium]